jgi:hypothetical protein
MASGLNYYAVFNTKLIDFLEDLNGVLGHVPDYKTLVTSAKFLARMNERQNAKLFIQFVSGPYGKEILERNESFFVDRDFKEAKDANAGDIVQLLKGVWKNLAKEDRDSIWAHLHMLVTIVGRL